VINNFDLPGSFRVTSIISFHLVLIGLMAYLLLSKHNDGTNNGIME
jgi:ABC-type tungstate transport system substrate-binding protein